MKPNLLRIRLFRSGCVNRPFYLVTVTKTKVPCQEPGIEQIGSYDPYPNAFNEHLVALNMERIRYWMSRGATLSVPVAQLLGLAGFLQPHPSILLKAYRNRKLAAQAAQAAKESEAKQSEEDSKPAKDGKADAS